MQCSPSYSAPDSVIWPAIGTPEVVRPRNANDNSSLESSRKDFDLRAEVVGERFVHQIEQRQAEQFVGVFEAEQLEVVVVRVDVHAFVHVRNGGGGVRQQQFAAALGFLQRAARLREAMALADVLEFALHYIKEALVVVVEDHVGGAHREAAREVLRLGRIVHHDDRQIRFALAQRRQYLLEVIEAGAAEQQIYGLFGDRFVGEVAAEFGTGGDAGVAQHGVDLMCAILGAIGNEETDRRRRGHTSTQSLLLDSFPTSSLWRARSETPSGVART